MQHEEVQTTCVSLAEAVGFSFGIKPINFQARQLPRHWELSIPMRKHSKKTAASAEAYAAYQHKQTLVLLSSSLSP